MTPEHNPHTALLGDLPAALDAKTMLMSGGFESLEEFGRVVDVGEQALTELLGDMDEPAWWRMQAICTIAHDIGKPVEFPEAIRGRHLEVRDQIVNWARVNGYLPEIPAPNE